MAKKLDDIRKHTMHDSIEPSEFKTEVHGFDFDSKVDLDSLVDSFSSTGFQATELSKAIDLINQMRVEKDLTLFFGYTSNMVSSGLRDVFSFLAKHNQVSVIVTTAGGIEEDFIKCLDPFLLGRFDLPGKVLREQGINRTGNVLVPNARYIKFEAWLNPILEELYAEQKNTGKILTPMEFIWRLGEKINNPKSIYYWCWKNKIPVYCPALLDGSIGDMIFFFSYKHHDFKLDIVSDIRKFNDIALDAKKTGLIILGSGVIKHSILNANMLRNGADYAVYVNTAQEFDGSDAGARPDEAVSWGKIQPNVENAESRMIKVFGDATILFPLIVSQTFAKKK